MNTSINNVYGLFSYFNNLFKVNGVYPSLPWFKRNWYKTDIFFILDQTNSKHYIRKIKIFWYFRNMSLQNVPIQQTKRRICIRNI